MASSSSFVALTAVDNDSVVAASIVLVIATTDPELPPPSLSIVGSFPLANTTPRRESFPSTLAEVNAEDGSTLAKNECNVVDGFLAGSFFPLVDVDVVVVAVGPSSSPPGVATATRTVDDDDVWDEADGDVGDVFPPRPLPPSPPGPARRW